MLTFRQRRPTPKSGAPIDVCRFYRSDGDILGNSLQVQSQLNDMSNTIAII
jgi:hypothetical protein